MAATETKKKTREIWADALKGVLILLVVLGHILPPPYRVLTTPAAYIFLFHLPAFFIISGYLQRNDGKSLGQSILLRTQRILVPYLVYVLLIAGGQILYHYLNGYASMRYLKKVVPAMLLGGQNLNQFFCGALWFMTAMFVASILFLVIEKLVPWVWLRIAIYLTFWAGAHIEAIFFIQGDGPTPWLWDVGFIACCYMAMGKYLKKYIFDRRVLIASAVVLAVLLALRLSGVSPYLNNFGIELWSHSHRYPILDFVVPFGIFVILANLVKLIPACRVGDFLADLGRYTIPIMALHQSIMQIMMINGLGNPLLMCVVASIVPYLLAKFVFARVKILNKVLI